MSIEDILSADELADYAQQTMKGLDPSKITRPPMKDEEFNDKTIEELGREMDALFRYVPGPGGGKLPSYWKLLKAEMHLLICTNDKKYADLRKQIAASGKESQIAIVGVIAAGVAATLGLAAGALVPFVALILIAIARVSKNAYCAGQELNVPLRGKREKGGGKS